jgi:Zn-dependent M16 (insulinase) family peptidase
VSKAQNDIPSAKREGDDMAKDVRNVIQLDENVSSKRATTTLRQETLLDELEKAFDEDEEGVVAKFDELRAECTLVPGDCGLMLVIKVDRVRINVIADVHSLPKPVSVWENFLPSKDVTSPQALSHN